MSTDAPALDQPVYRASYPVAIARFFLKYATFSGRASRSEFWWWMLTSVLVNSVLGIVGRLVTGNWSWSFDLPPSSAELVTTFPGAIGAVFALGTLVPSIAVIWRRLHDAGLDGAWFFIGLIPVVGGIILIVLTLFDTDPAGARFDTPGGIRIR